MTDEQIIDGLRCCQDSLCTICPNENCTDDLFGLAIDLINRQKAEIERLNVEIKAMRGAANSYKLEYKRLLRKLQQEKSETIKEVADKINVLLARYSHLHNIEKDFRLLAKEMTDGETK